MHEDPLMQAQRVLLERAHELDIQLAVMTAIIQVVQDPCLVVDHLGMPQVWNDAASPHMNRDEIGRSILAWSGKYWRPDGTVIEPEDTPLAIAVRTGQPVRGFQMLARFHNTPDTLRKLTINAAAIDLPHGRMSVVSWRELASIATGTGYER